MAEATATLTYEALFELLRKEKSGEEIQKLGEDTFLLIPGYLNDRIKTFKMSEGQASDDEKERARIQVANIRKLIKEMIERRERKIINLAMNKSLTQSDSISGNALLPEESIFYQKMVDLFNEYHKSVLIRLLNGSEPSYAGIPAPAKEEKKQETASGDAVTVRFLHYVPKFLGEEMEVYGPFEPEDIANFPAKIARILIAKGRAEEMVVRDS